MSSNGTLPEKKIEIKLRAGSEISNLEKMRVARGMTQQQLSEKSGVPIYTIQGFERLARNINGTGIERLLDFCIALECQIEDIVEGKDVIEKAKKLRMASSAEVSSGDTFTYEYPQNLLKDILADEEEAASCVDSEDTLEHLYSKLPENWGAILKLRYKDKYTLEVIGNKYQVTRARARQIIEFALEKLREPQNIECLMMGVKAYKNHCEKNEYQLSLQKANRRLSEVPIDELKLSGRAYNCLMKAGFDTIGKASELDYSELCAMKNMGETAAKEVIQKIKAYAEKRNSVGL